MFDFILSGGWNPIYMVYIWLAVGILAFIIEYLTSDLSSIWATAAAIIVMIISIFVHIYWLQIVLFIVITLILVLAARPVAKKYFKTNTIKTNTDTLIGKHAVVIANITEENKGRVKVEGKDWRAISSDGKDINVNTSVEIVAIEGIKLVVKTFEE